MFVYLQKNKVMLAWIGFFFFGLMLFGLIGSKIWPTPDPHAKEWSDKALGIKKKHRYSK
jgi:hypothetical protein